MRMAVDPGTIMTKAQGLDLIASSVDLGWNKAAICRVQGTSREWAQDFSDVPALALHTNGNSVRVGIDNRWSEERSRPGLLSFFPALTTARFQSGGNFRSIVMFLDPSCFDETTDDAASGSGRLHARATFKDDFASAAVTSLMEEVENPGETGSLYADSLACTLGLHLLRKCTSARNSPPRLTMSRRTLQQSLDLIEESIESGISLQQLSASVGLSRAYFATAFKASTGMGAHRYLTSRRVARAADLLANTGVAISQIAGKCGFSSQAHFSECFKRTMGCTPLQYRRGSSV